MTTPLTIPVPLIRQPHMSNDCGVACVAMIAEYYDLQLSYEEIRQELGVYSWGTCTPQLGRFFLAHGFEVEIIGLHPLLFSTHSTHKDSSELIHYLKSLEGTMKESCDHISLTHFISYLEEGGILTPRIPTAQDIASELKEQRPLLVPLSHWFLHKTTLNPRFSIHFNVISGQTDSTFLVNDPDWGEDFGGIHHMDQTTLMYAIYISAKGGIDDACVMKIKRRG